MAEFPAFTAVHLQDQITARHDLGYPNPPPVWTDVSGEIVIEALKAEAQPFGAHERAAAYSTHTTAVYAAFLGCMPQDDFFGQIIMTPRTIAAGFVASLKVFILTIYNSFKSATRSLDSFVNNAGAGVVITDLPGLPENIPPQSGLTLTLHVQPLGPPVINGTLDFTFDIETVIIPVTGIRTVLFPFEPEAPMVERLVWLTDIHEKRDGTEQRMALRDNPRQVFEMSYLLDGKERQKFQATVFDAQIRAVGVPMWHEPATLQAPGAPISATTITVDSTAYADYRVDGLAIVWRDFDNFESLEIASFTATTITFKTPFVAAFTAGARVMPLRVCFMRRGAIRGHKFPLTVEARRVTFETKDNAVDLSDVTAFPTFNSKVLLDEENFIRGTLQETIERRQKTELDYGPGTFELFSEVDVSQRSHPKTFHSNSRQRLWEVRQLLHALRGRQISFYIPTFFNDLSAVSGILSGGNTVDVTNVGYTVFINAQPPWNVVRLTENDGTEVVRTVTTTTEISPTVERLQISGTWGVDMAEEDITRIDFVEKARFSTDEITLTHRNARGNAEIKAAVLALTN